MRSPLADAAGAARQYSGTVGGIALCQMAVTLTYATGRGHALIGRALYLPEACAADEEHRELAGVPEEVMFASKPQLADTLLDRAAAPAQHRHPIGEIGHTGCTGRPGAAATSTAPAKPINAGTPTQRQHRDHNELQLS